MFRPAVAISRFFHSKQINCSIQFAWRRVDEEIWTSNPCWNIVPLYWVCGWTKPCWNIVPLYWVCGWANTCWNIVPLHWVCGWTNPCWNIVPLYSVCGWTSGSPTHPVQGYYVSTGPTGVWCPDLFINTSSRELYRTILFRVKNPDDGHCWPKHVVFCY